MSFSMAVYVGAVDTSQPNDVRLVHLMNAPSRLELVLARHLASCVDVAPKVAYLDPEDAGGTSAQVYIYPEGLGDREGIVAMVTPCGGQLGVVQISGRQILAIRVAIHEGKIPLLEAFAQVEGKERLSGESCLPLIDWAENVISEIGEERETVVDLGLGEV